MKLNVLVSKYEIYIVLTNFPFQWELGLPLRSKFRAM